jgi:hypothetical protein
LSTPYENDDVDDFVDRICRHGARVAYQEWDSGAPGIGAGIVSVWEYKGEFWVIGEDHGPLFGPYPTEQDAITGHEIDVINDATVEIWEKEAGVVWSKAEDGEPDESL